MTKEVTLFFSVENIFWEWPPTPTLGVIHLYVHYVWRFVKEIFYVQMKIIKKDSTYEIIHLFPESTKRHKEDPNV